MCPNCRETSELDEDGELITNYALIKNNGDADKKKFAFKPALSSKYLYIFQIVINLYFQCGQV